MQLTFKQQLVLTLLDKGLLALLLAVAAFIGSRLLEKFKATQAVRSETTKARIQAMNTTWAAITGWRAFALARSHPYQTTEDWGESRKQIRHGFDDAIESLERNRFLAGNEFSDDALEYAARLMQYYQDVVFAGQWDMSGQYAELRKLSADIRSVERYLSY
jgi:hypothetical protein